MGLEDQLRYFHNSGDGTFEDRTARAGIEGEVGGLNIVQADYDNDGTWTCSSCAGAGWEARGSSPCPSSETSGDGTFEDVTRAAGLLRPRSDPDGHLARLRRRRLARPVRGQRDFPGRPRHGRSPLRAVPQQQGRNLHRTWLTEAGVDVGASSRPSSSGDYDNDGEPGSLRVHRGQSKPAVPERGPAPKSGRLALRRRHRPGRRRRAGVQLRGPLLRLRQRRLARSLRGGLRLVLRIYPARPGRGATTWGFQTTAREAAFTTTRATAPSRT